MTSGAQYTAANSTPVTVRLTDAEIGQVDVIASHLTTGTGKPSRPDAIRRAISDLYARCAPAIAANQAAWDALVSMRGDAALLTLHGVGVGEPLPEDVTITRTGRRDITPRRWEQMDVSVTLNGQPVELPLVIERAHLHFTVYLTDQAGQARVCLGPLSRIVGEHPAYYDNRLFRIAKELGLSTQTAR